MASEQVRTRQHTALGMLATLISVVYLGVRPGPCLWKACLLVVAGAWVCNWAFE